MNIELCPFDGNLSLCKFCAMVSMGLVHMYLCMYIDCEVSNIFSLGGRLRM